MSITKNAQFRRGLRFKLRDDPGTGRYDTVCIINETTHGAPPGSVRLYDGDPVLYLCSCNGKHREVGQRVVDLLNTHGLTDEDEQDRQMLMLAELKRLSFAYPDKGTWEVINKLDPTWAQAHPPDDRRRS